MQKEQFKWAVTIVYLADKTYPKTIARVDSLKRAIRIGKSFEKQSGLLSKHYSSQLGDTFPSGEIVMTRCLLKEGKDYLIISIDEDKFSSSFEQELNRLKNY